MSIDPTDPRSPSRQIADALGAAIRSGELPPRSKLPSERQLVERYGTAAQTARQAIGLLKSEGLVVGMPGRGIFVRERPSLVRVGSDRYTRWFQAETDTDMRWHEELLQLAEVPAPERIAEVFGIASGSTVFLRRRRIWLEGAPTQLDDSYYQLDVVRGTPIVHGTTGPGGSYRQLEQLGYTLTHIREDITLRMPTPDEVRSLRLNKGVPVAELHRVALTDDGPLEAFNAVLDGDRHVFSYGFPPPPANDRDVPNGDQPDDPGALHEVERPADHDGST